MSAHITATALGIVTDRLMTALPDINVYRRMLSQVADRALPAIILQYDGESISDAQGRRSAQPIQERQIRFSVIAALKIFDAVDRFREGETLEDRLLEMIGRIESVLLDPDLESDFVHDIGASGIELDVEPESDRPLGYARLSCSMTVRCRAGAPTTSI